MFRFTPIVDALPGELPFTAPERLERGVFVRKPQVPPLDRCVRVSVGSPEERRSFGDVLRELRSTGVF